MLNMSTGGGTYPSVLPVSLLAGELVIILVALLQLVGSAAQW